MKYGIHSLVFKQCLTILLGITIIFAVLFGFLRYGIGSQFSSLLMERGTEVSEKNVSLINNIFSEAEIIGQNVVLQLGNQGVDEVEFPETMKSILKNAREKLPETVAIVVATEPTSKGEFMRLAYYSGDSVSILPGKDYAQKAWYQNAKAANKPMWHDPFVGDFVTEPIAVYSAPFYIKDENGTETFGGVICVDISIAFLQKTVTSISVADQGYAFVLSPKNTIVAHKRADWVYKESLASLRAKGSRLAKLEDAIRESGLLQKSKIVLDANIDGRDLCIYVTPMDAKGWTFGIVWESDKFFAQRSEMSRYFIIALVGCYLFMLALVLVVSFRVARPLNKMSRVAHDIGNGNFDVKIPVVSGKDEVAQFAMAFNKMRESLIEYIENLKNVTDKNMRMESELNVARDIQLGVLPQDEDEESMRDARHDLSAFLQPARGVGGDFYDFYPLDKDRIVILIADVSGKGVPAALFMMSVRTQLKSLALTGLSVDQVFNKANERLAHKNESNMFVTVWMGVLDLRTGHIDFCSAGHNPPAICHTDGSTEFIKSKAGLVMAGLPETHYKLQSIDLAPGETIFLYTDGVTESSNEWDKFFGDGRLLTSLQTCAGIPTNKMCSFMKSRIDEFTGSAPQFDDITMLVLKYNGPEG